MSGPLVFASKPPESGVSIGEPIPQSVMLNRASASYMVMTGAGDADSNTTGTVSFWVKRSASLSSQQAVWSSYVASSDTNFVEIGFHTDDTLYVSNWTVHYLKTTQVFRDTSAWYHIVVRFDTTDGTADDRVRLWVNGTEVTSFGTRNNPGSSATLGISSAASTGIRVGQSTATGSTDVDGYLADFYFIDGTAYDASDFGEFNTQGHWIPKVFAGSYGTYGYRLTFADNTHFGDDTSGNGNDLTDSGLGTDHKKADTPTNNHCTWNPLGSSTTHVLSEGNLLAANSSAGGSWSRASGTFFMESGKWYWEVNCDTAAQGFITIGVASAIASTSYLGVDNEGWSLENPSSTNLAWRHDGTLSSFLTSTGTMLTGDYVMVAHDADTGKTWLGINGSWIESGDPAAGSNELFVTDRVVAPAMSSYSTSEDIRLRTAEADFEGTMPVGFKALNSQNLPEPLIPKGSDCFDILTWTGDGSNPRDIVGLDFDPSLTWIQSRNLAQNRLIYDAVRGAEYDVRPDVADAEVNQAGNGYLSAFITGGITVTNGGTSDNFVNNGSDLYTAFNWLESISQGLDIVSYSGTGTAQAIAHNLGVVPDLIIVKNRDQGDSWAVLHMDSLLSSGVPVSDPETDWLRLDTTDVLTDDATIWNDTAPDANEFTVGTAHNVNASGENYIAYVFAGVPGFSKFGSYIGNGVADGPFVWTGHRPKLLVVKRLPTGANWFMQNNVGQGHNVVNQAQVVSANSAEDTSSYPVDLLANGFKQRGTNASFNASASEYLFWSWAEHPFKYARAF